MNFLLGADPRMVYEFFRYGLAGKIHIDRNLTELSYFSDPIQAAVRGFIRYCVKPEQICNISLTSSPPSWDEDGRIRLPYHYGTLGYTRKNMDVIIQELSPLPIISPDQKLLAEAQIGALMAIFYKTRQIKGDSEVKVNFSSTKILITSFSPKPITETDAQKVIIFEHPSPENELEIPNMNRAFYCQDLALNDGGLNREHQCSLR